MPEAPPPVSTPLLRLKVHEQLAVLVQHTGPSDKLDRNDAQSVSFLARALRDIDNVMRAESEAERAGARPGYVIPNPAPTDAVDQRVRGALHDVGQSLGRVTSEDVDVLGDAVIAALGDLTPIGRTT
ncbi:MAG: hypothetical protein WKF96_00225 [Solirubrobacteraceae bacterium]